MAYNTRFVEHLFKQLSPKAKFDVSSQSIQNAIQLGKMWAAVALLGARTIGLLENIIFVI